MKKTGRLGMVLVILGVVALLLGEFRYPSRVDILEVGSFKAGVETKKTFRIHPAIAVVLLLGGTALLVSNRRRSSH